MGLHEGPGGVARGRDVQTGEVPGGDGGRAEAGQARALGPLRDGAEDLYGDDAGHRHAVHLHSDLAEESEV